MSLSHDGTVFPCMNYIIDSSFLILLFDEWRQSRDYEFDFMEIKITSKLLMLFSLALVKQ